LWYGYKTNKLNKNLSKLKINNKNKYNLLLIFNPLKWELIFIKNNLTNSTSLFYYSRVYFYKITIINFKYKLLLNKNTNSIYLTLPFANNYFKVYINFLKRIFNLFSKPFFKKLKFKGKGYYVFKVSRNTITFQFGYSHRFYLYSYFTSITFLTKTIILVFGLLRQDILEISYNIKNIKKINIYTGRGIRFAKQIIYKKAGKVSSYR